MAKVAENSSQIETGEKPIITILDDPKKYTVTHPLQNAWTLWFDFPEKKQTEKTWTQNVKPIITIRTIEEFWGVFNNIPAFQNIPTGANYHFFKEGVKPMWEDSANANGGRWLVEYPRRVEKDINEKWINTMLALIGESYQDSQNICGIVFSNRKTCYRFSMWTRSPDTSQGIKEIGETFLKYLNRDKSNEIESIPFNRHVASRGAKPLFEAKKQ